MTCKEYQVSNNYSEDDLKFENFVKGANFKQCPKCSYWVERALGCSTMTCKCGTEFCYDCGGTKCPHGRCLFKSQQKIKAVKVPRVPPKRPAKPPVIKPIKRKR